MKCSNRSFYDFSIEALLKKDGTRGEVQLPGHPDIKKVSRNSPVICSTFDQLSNNDVLPLPHGVNDPNCIRETQDVGTFTWLSCTRFKPPKISRSRKKSTSRRHGRGPRIPFSSHQLAVLEHTFFSSQYLSSEATKRLAGSLHLTEIRVKIWFQNRRARYRREHCTYSDDMTCNLPPEPYLSKVSASASKPNSGINQYPCPCPCPPQESEIQAIQGSEIGHRQVHATTAIYQMEQEHACSTVHKNFTSKQRLRHLINDIHLLTAVTDTSKVKDHN